MSNMALLEESEPKIPNSPDYEGIIWPYGTLGPITLEPITLDHGTVEHGTLEHGTLDQNWEAARF